MCLVSVASAGSARRRCSHGAEGAASKTHSAHSLAAMLRRCLRPRPALRQPALAAHSPRPLLRAASQLADLSLLVEPSGLPRLPPASALPPPTVQVSTLANGLRVCTQETYGQVASLALFIDAGSMYESEADGTIGASRRRRAAASSEQRARRRARPLPTLAPARPFYAPRLRPFLQAPATFSRRWRLARASPAAPPRRARWRLRWALRRRPCLTARC